MQLRECLWKDCVDVSTRVIACTAHTVGKSKKEIEEIEKEKERKGENKDGRHRSQEHAQCHHLFLLSWNTERP